MVKIVFTNQISPFDIALYIPSSEIIYIDVRMRQSKYLGYIIRHELSHTTDKRIDWKTDFERQPEGFVSDVLHRKPLWILARLVPFAWVYDKKKLNIYFDPLGACVDGLLVMIILSLVFLRMVL
jgi:hypothetical protein